MHASGRLIAVVCLLFLACGEIHAHNEVYQQVDELTSKLTGPADEMLIRRARLFLEAGHPEAAREEPLAALQAAPNRHEAYFDLGRQLPTPVDPLNPLWIDRISCRGIFHNYLTKPGYRWPP